MRAVRGGLILAQRWSVNVVLALSVVAGCQRDTLPGSTPTTADGGVTDLLPCLPVDRASPLFVGLRYVDTPFRISQVLTADFDGDGDLDVAAGSDSRNAAVILTNRGDGSLRKPMTLDEPGQ